MAFCKKMFIIRLIVQLFSTSDSLFFDCNSSKSNLGLVIFHQLRAFAARTFSPFFIKFKLFAASSPSFRPMHIWSASLMCPMEDTVLCLLVAFRLLIVCSSSNRTTTTELQQPAWQHVDGVSA
uniref:Secreted protein n=1 Tax=Globodera rostochiensis TaxID=31243 RepID=A0A914HEW7_GLORO